MGIMEIILQKKTMTMIIILMLMGMIKIKLIKMNEGRDNHKFIRNNYLSLSFFHIFVGISTKQFDYLILK